MKRLLVVAICAAMSLSAFAQDNQKQKEDFRAKQIERVQSEKIAFFTNELDLTPEEAQVFWPVYNSYTKESQAAHKEVMKAFSSLGCGKEQVSDKQMEANIDAYIKAVKSEQDVLSAYYPKFKKVLPIQKVAKLYQAEEAFKMKMIHKLRKGGPAQNEPMKRGSFGQGMGQHQGHPQGMHQGHPQGRPEGAPKHQHHQSGDPETAGDTTE